MYQNIRNSALILMLLETFAARYSTLLLLSFRFSILVIISHAILHPLQTNGVKLGATSLITGVRKYISGGIFVQLLVSLATRSQSMLDYFQTVKTLCYIGGQYRGTFLVLVPSVLWKKSTCTAVPVLLFLNF